VALFKEHSSEVSLVLLDMTMPHMSGEEAFNEMYKIRDDVKVLLSSGYNEQDATSHFTGMGLAGFIQKPYKPSDLVKKIRAILGE
jgi:two-component system cell cycle sensor histidine kinase/response regulator CckA